MSQSGYVRLDDCRIVRTTDAAILVEYDGDSFWFPKTQVADPDDFAAGDGPVTVSVTDWIARQKGIDTD